MKLFKRCSLLVLSLAFSMSIMSGNASAASDYDNLLVTSPTLYVYTDGYTKSKKMDISRTWWPEFKQTYAKRVLQGIGWPTNFATEFEYIVQNGGSWGVASYKDSTGVIVEIYGTRDPDAYCGFVGSASTGSYQCASNPGYGFVRASFFTHNSYAGLGCFGGYADRCSETGMNMYAAPEIFTGTAGYTMLYMPNSALQDYPFFFMNFDQNYPTGYEGELISEEPPAAKYVAMGDSFSSGEGNPPFEFGSDSDSENECHRSQRAYPRLLQLESSLNLGSTAFVACSGATTNDVLGESETDNPNGRWNQDPQIDALTGDTELVTITIGGNNVGFKEFAFECLFLFDVILIEGSCDEFTPIYEETVEKITYNLPSELEDTYEAILENAPSADIYIVGYPRISPFKDIEDSFDQDCGGLYGAFPNYWGDARAAYEVVNLINSTIEQAVDTINYQESSTRLHYVDVTSGNFYGHDVCESDSYFYGIEIPTAYSVHPNEGGHVAYKDDLVDLLD